MWIETQHLTEAQLGSSNSSGNNNNHNKIKAPQTSRRTQFFVATITSLKKYLLALASDQHFSSNATSSNRSETTSSHINDLTRSEWKTEGENMFRIYDSYTQSTHNQYHSSTLQIAQVTLSLQIGSDRPR